MAGTHGYDDGVPDSSTTTEVRLLIGDTNSNDWLLSDEEIAYFIGEEPTLYRAAAECCDAIAAKLARDLDRSAVGLNSNATVKYDHYKELAKRLRRKSGSAGVKSFAGGYSKTANAVQDDNTDNVDQRFSNDAHRNPGNVSSED